MTSDRRVHPRFPLILAIQYVGADSVLDYTENLSEGGLFIRTEREFDRYLDLVTGDRHAAPAG